MVYCSPKGDNMSKDLSLCDLLDVYGPLLTEKQRRLLELYYYDDLSLSEIVENEGGSRQGALDMIKRAGKELLQMEQALSLVKNARKRGSVITELKAALEAGDSEKAKKLTSVLEELG